MAIRIRPPWYDTPFPVTETMDVLYYTPSAIICTYAA